MTSHRGQMQEMRFFDQEVETMERSKLCQLQEKRLLQILPYAYARSPLMRQVWDQAGVKPDSIRSLADFFAKAPFMDKDAIRIYRDQYDDPYGGLLCARAPHLKGVGLTGGTTGDATPLPRGTESSMQHANKRVYWSLGVRPGDYITYIQFTSRLGHHADRWTNAGFRLFPLSQRPEDVPRLVEGSRLMRPKVLHMLSTPLIIALEEYAQDTGDDLREAFSSYKAAIFGGEPLGPRFRELVESWGLEVYQMGTAEVGPMTECRMHAGMHVWEDTCLLEHLRPGSNEPAAPGERGEVVVTALADDVAPMVRFRLGDLAECSFEACGCGRTHARVWPIGRLGDEVLVGGQSILPVDLMPIIQNIRETGNGLFQIIRPRRELDQLQLRVGFNTSMMGGSTTELVRRVETDVRAKLHVAVSVEVVPNERLLKLGPSHKIPRVVVQ